MDLFVWTSKIYIKDMCMPPDHTFYVVELLAKTNKIMKKGISVTSDGCWKISFHTEVSN